MALFVPPPKTHGPADERAQGRGGPVANSPQFDIAIEQGGTEGPYGRSGQEGEQEARNRWHVFTLTQENQDDDVG